MTETEQDQDRVVGKVVNDLNKHGQHLARLKAKADQMAKALEWAIRLLRGEDPGNIDEERQIAIGGGVAYVKGTYPTADEVSNILNDIKVTKEEIDNLRRQAHQLGISRTLS